MIKSHKAGKPIFVILAILSAILINNSDIMPPARSDGVKNAYIVGAEYAAKIYVNKNDIWNFTVRNINCAEDIEGRARFFFKFHINDELSWNEYNSTSYRTWPCNKSRAVRCSYRIEGWRAIQPFTHNIKLELYWYYNGTSYLQDTMSFSIAVGLILPLRHIYTSSYLAVYLLACLTLSFYYYYITKLKL